jgi:pimeloyl-ACP methyl ester carboxylesterase
LVRAGEKDILVSPASLKTLCENIPDVTVEHLPSCGHLACVTKPELIRRKVMAFLQA